MQKYEAIQIPGHVVDDSYYDDTHDLSQAISIEKILFPFKLIE
ncbi:hypothetical protein AwDysgo_16240 [Bacteroidales bacterium]|nr:hypothetical protein AwDysgo_16240 [Bacteroidales bacterium]